MIDSCRGLSTLVCMGWALVYWVAVAQFGEGAWNEKDAQVARRAPATNSSVPVGQILDLKLDDVVMKDLLSVLQNTTIPEEPLNGK